METPSSTSSKKKEEKRKDAILFCQKCEKQSPKMQQRLRDVSVMLLCFVVWTAEVRANITETVEV